MWALLDVWQLCTDHKSKPCDPASSVPNTFYNNHRVPEVESIFFNLPNLHFLPCPVVASKVRPCPRNVELQHFVANLRSAYPCIGATLPLLSTAAVHATADCEHVHSL